MNTGARYIGITADHVYRKYLEELQTYGPEAIECQFGSSTIYSERRLIDQNPAIDIATFDIPAVFVSSSTQHPKAHHHAVRWPPRRLMPADVVIYGG